MVLMLLHSQLYHAGCKIYTVLCFSNVDCSPRNWAVSASFRTHDNLFCQYIMMYIVKMCPV